MTDRTPAYAISMKLEKAASQLEALGNPTRLNIYRMLVRAGDDGLPVGKLQVKLDIAGLDAVASSASGWSSRPGDARNGRRRR